MNFKPITANTQIGSSLIEVLVSMLILLVGILGVAGLQTQGLTNTKSSYLRTQAAIFAEDIFDRMRSNREGAELKRYDVADSSTITASAYNYTTGGIMTMQELATADLQDWYAKVSTTLPLAKFTITTDDEEIATLVLMWDDDKRGSVGTNCGVDVTCMTFTSGM